MFTESSGDPRVSVVIPTHNRQALLRRVLEGLANQSYPFDRFEVIVVVDGSSDDTMDLLTSLTPPYNLCVLQQEQQGPAAARNTGIAAACGDVIVFLDDDVIPQHSLVSGHARFHATDCRAVVVGRLLPCAGGSRPGWERWEEAIFNRQYQKILGGKMAVDSSHFYSGNVSAQTRSLRELDGFDRTLAYHEDVDLGRRLQMTGHHFYFASDAAGYHCGYCPDFRSWCRRHYRFGFYRPALQRRAQSGQISSFRRSFSKYNVLTRTLLRVVLGRPTATNISAAILRAAVTELDSVHLWAVSRCGYSVLATLNYWQGVYDALGDGDYLRQTLFSDNAPERSLSNTA